MMEYWEQFNNPQSIFRIYYPTCGGGEECINACPKADEIWQLKPMTVSLFGVAEQTRLRPVIVNPDACLKCLNCVKACPTGALVLKEEYPIKHPYLKALWIMLKVVFRKRYGLKYTLRKEHIDAFMRNNFLNKHKKQKNYEN